MKPDIIEKIRSELQTLPVKDEKTVLYVLAEIRKILEHDELLRATLPTLQFYCNWALHVRLDKAFAKQFIQRVSPLLTFKGNWTAEQFADLHGLLTLQRFRDELKAFLTECAIDASVCEDENWVCFLKLYSRVVQDSELVMKGTSEPAGALKLAIESVTVRPTDGDPEFKAAWLCPMQWLVQYADGRKAAIVFSNRGLTGSKLIAIPPLNVAGMARDVRERLMQRLFVYRTSKGPFYIVRMPDGTFHPLYEDESLGSYSNPEKALGDLVGGHTFMPNNGVDTSTLGIPDDFSEWESF
jgi:hypothetical protein